jgi:hypothetical protein
VTVAAEEPQQQQQQQQHSGGGSPAAAAQPSSDAAEAPAPKRARTDGSRKAPKPKRPAAALSPQAAWPKNLRQAQVNTQPFRCHANCLVTLQLIFWTPIHVCFVCSGMLLTLGNAATMPSCLPTEGDGVYAAAQVAWRRGRHTKAAAAAGAEAGHEARQGAGVDRGSYATAEGRAKAQGECRVSDISAEHEVLCQCCCHGL